MTPQVDVRFHRLAEREYLSSYRWYSEQSAGRAERFAAAVEYAIERIARDPDAFPIELGDYRRIRVSRFPYDHFFRRRSERLVAIVAVAHTSRRPHYWRHRK
jgi:plasmid stabilization system protein ParE